MDLDQQPRQVTQRSAEVMPHAALAVTKREAAAASSAKLRPRADDVRVRRPFAGREPVFAGPYHGRKRARG